MPVQFRKKATYRFAITTATVGLWLFQAGQASAAPVPAPLGVIPVQCSGHALSAAVASAPPSSVLALAAGCTYLLARGLPTIDDTLDLQGPAT
ncbi:MAG TPA: hypothetical protein VMA95_00130, partial [Streptosporangiaceae bacterium]|nr:hypothetical protein [Streptosporangiaceae bacterium]